MSDHLYRCMSTCAGWSASTLRSTYTVCRGILGRLLTFFVLLFFFRRGWGGGGQNSFDRAYLFPLKSTHGFTVLLKRGLLLMERICTEREKTHFQKGPGCRKANVFNPSPADPGYALPWQTVQKKPTDMALHCLPFSI